MTGTLAFFGPTGLPLPVVEGGVLLQPVTTVQATFSTTVNRAQLVFRPTGGVATVVAELIGLSTQVVTFVWHVPSGTMGTVWVVGCNSNRCFQTEQVAVTSNF